MQSASSLNHTEEGNSLCNEIFFFFFSQGFQLSFLSVDELRNWQRGQTKLAQRLTPFVLSKGSEEKHVLGSLTCL